jgi:predicted RNA methylase
MTEIYSLIKDKRWEDTVDELFSKKGNRELPVREELIHILEENGEEIESMYDNFVDRQDSDMIENMRRHFPELSDYQEESLSISSFNPELTKAVIVSFYMRRKMPDFYDILKNDVEAIRSYLNGDDSKRGQQKYMNIVRGRRMSEKKSKNWILEGTSDMETELSDYEEETEAYEDLDVSKFVLKTNDAVKCLEDFEGRTFPFIRSVVRNIDNGDKVIEVGAGTGVLSVSAAVAGADTVIGIELNPVTCLLSDIIVSDLYQNGLIDRRESVNIVWSDALKFGEVEYTQYDDFKFDAIISENIYTGMFYELQMQMISRIMENDLVEVQREIINGYTHRTTSANLVPEAMASAAELVDLGEYEPSVASEVLIDVEDKGYGVNKKLTRSYPYDILSYNVEEPSNIMVQIRYNIIESGKIDAINIYSVVKLSDGDYIVRNENEFLNNDHLVHLNKPVKVEEGDEVIATIGYNEADAVTDGIFEIRSVDGYNNIPDDYDSRMNITSRKHQINKLNYKRRNNIKQNLELGELGDKEQLRCSSYYHNYKHTWRTNLDI